MEGCLGKFEVESIVSENALEDSGELGWGVGVESQGCIAGDGTHRFAVTNYGGDAHGHGFEDGEAETFDERGEDEGAGVAKNLAELLIAEESGEGDVIFEILASDERGEWLAVADKNEVTLLCLGAELSKCVDEEAKVFVFFVVSDGDDVGCLLCDEAGEDVGGRFGRLEKYRVDAVGDGGDAAAVDPVGGASGGGFGDGNDVVSVA